MIAPFFLPAKMRHPTSAATVIIHQVALPLDPGVYHSLFQKEHKKEQHKVLLLLKLICRSGCSPALPYPAYQQSKYSVNVFMTGIITIQGYLEKLLPPLILAIVSSSQ
jgi:hypothetical protein